MFQKVPGLREGRDPKGHRGDRPCAWAGEGHTEKVSQHPRNLGVKTLQSDPKVHLDNDPDENRHDDARRVNGESVMVGSDREAPGPTAA